MLPRRAARARSPHAAQSGSPTTPVPTSRPRVNRSVSPGRKKPTSRPHSAKMIAAATQGAQFPSVERFCGSSQLGPMAARPAEVLAAWLTRAAVKGVTTARVRGAPYGDPVTGLGEEVADDRTRSVGVGPWEGPWPDDPRYDRELLRDGDRRNVADRYRYWTMDAIRADLDPRRHGFHVAVENW